MKSMRNRMVILALAITVILGLLACSTTGGLIARNDPTATPTKTPKPTFTITPTPTDTPIPTDTPTPTATFTPTPEATNTPIVLTATPTEVPTDTPVPTNTTAPPTATRRPPTRVPATATPAPPTNTPAPQFQWVGAVVWDQRFMANCGGVGITKHSIIKDRAGNPVNGVRVLMDCYGNQLISHPSGNPGEYDAGHYDFFGISTGPANYTCTARVYDYNGEPVTSSQTVTIVFDTGPCEPGGTGHQQAIVNWTKNY